MTEYTLKNGIKCIWLSDFYQPVLTVTLQVPRGKHCDPETLEGTAELAVSLMEKGPASLSGEDFVERLENSGATLFADVKEEYIIIGIRLLQRAADEIIPLFWEMICSPAFDIKEFNRLKKEMITGLQAEFSDPSTLAGKHFSAELFGSSHPAGRMHSIESVKRITLQNVKDFFTSCVAPGGCQMIVAGAMKTDDMRKKWETLFESWNRESKEVQTRYEPLPYLIENRIRIIDKSEYSQTTLILGHQCINELHEQKVSLAIANYILGAGNFSSRLMKRIRTEAGRTYSIASMLSCRKNYGVFSIGTSTQNNQLKTVLNSVLDVYNTFVNEGATDSEIDKAKQFAAGNMAFELEGLNNVVEKLLWMRFFGRDNSYIESYESLIDPVNAASLKKALHEHMRFTNFVIIAVGKKNDILDQMESFGRVTCFNYRSNPLTA